MRIEKVKEKIIKVTVDQNDYNLDEYYNNLIFLESKNILAFGDTNYRIFEKFFTQKDMIRNYSISAWMVIGQSD